MKSIQKNLRIQGLIALVLALFIQGSLKAQLQVSKTSFYSPKNQSRVLEKIHAPKNQMSIGKRGNGVPVLCGTDTSTYANIGSSLDYRLVFLGNGQNLGMFFNAPQEITLNGFRFFAFLPYDTVSKNVSTTVKAKIYAAGIDSLPIGQALDSVTVQIDTLQGALNFENTIHDVLFNQPLKLTTNYVIALEQDLSGLGNAANVVTNNWMTRDGLGLNLAKVQLNNRWYNAQDINLDGYLFDANFLIYPFVSYSISTQFNSPDDCYKKLDTLVFENQHKESVLSSPFYNEYAHYQSTGFGSWSHTWTFNDTAILESQFDGKFRPNDYFNVRTKLVSYMVPYSRNLDFCFDSSESIIHFTPTAPTLTDNNGCIGTTENIQLNAHPELEYEWYLDTTQGTPFQKGIDYQISNFNKTTTYYISSINTGNNACRLEKSPITFMVNEFPTKLTLPADSFNVCSGAFAVLEGSSDFGTVYWYADPTGGTPLHQGNTYQTEALNASAYYYAEANNNGCALKSSRSKIAVKVSSNFAPAVPTVSGNTVTCIPEFQTRSLTLSATPASGSSVRWFTNPTTSNVASTNSNYTVDIYNRGDYYVYVQSWNGACGSSRLPVKVTGNRAPILREKRTEDICFGDTAKLSAFAYWGEVDWYLDSLPGSKSVATGNFVSLYLKDTGLQKVFVKVREGACLNDTWYAIPTIVRPTIIPSNIKADSVCRGSSAQIELTKLNRELSLLWYESATSKEVISIDSTLNLGRILSSTTRFLETDFRGCRSKRIPITVGTLHQPVAGFRVSYPTEAAVYCEPINLNSISIKWNFGDGNTSSNNTPTHTYGTTGAYKVTMIANSTLSKCADTAYADVNVVVNSLKKMNLAGTLYPNPAVIGESIHLKWNESATSLNWELFDVTGKRVSEVQTIHPTSGNYFEVKMPSGLESGLYLFKCNSQSSSHAQWLQLTK